MPSPLGTCRTSQTVCDCNSKPRKSRPLSGCSNTRWIVLSVHEGGCHRSSELHCLLQFYIQNHPEDCLKKVGNTEGCQKYKETLINNLFIEGSLISEQALFSLRALFGATWVHSYIWHL